MSFTDHLNTLPNNARTQEATGFLPPMARTSGHLLYVLAMVAGTAEWENLLSADEALAELTHAKTHWDVITDKPALSAATTAHLKTFGLALTDAITEFPAWDRDVKTRNLQLLSNRLVGLLAVCDRELLGLRNSDPGIAL